MSTSFCNNCGHRNPDASNFCSSCGAPLELGEDETSTIVLAPIEGAGEVDTDDITVALDDLPEGVGLLVVKRGPNVGSRFLLDQPVTRVGRHPDSEIFLDDVTVSRRHAEFAKVESSYVVRDVGSLNGTYLNRERVEEQPLTSGDEVQIGKFKLVFLGGVSSES